MRSETIHTFTSLDFMDATHKALNCIMIFSRKKEDKSSIHFASLVSIEIRCLVKKSFIKHTWEHNYTSGFFPLSCPMSIFPSLDTIFPISFAKTDLLQQLHLLYICAVYRRSPLAKKLTEEQKYPKNWGKKRQKKKKRKKRQIK